MPDFKRYIDHFGLPEDQAAMLRQQLRSWEDLHRWMDENQLPQTQPGMQRLSIIAPALPMSWKQNLRQKIRGQLTAPDQASRGWERLVEYRRRVALLLSLVTTVLLLLISAQTLRAEQMPVAAMRMYLVIYGVMTYFLASNSYKLFLGTWHTWRGAAANPWHPSKLARDPDPGVKVALVYPVRHENAARVAAGIAATWSSIVEENPALSCHFDNFLLSDSRGPEYWIAETAAIHELRSSFPLGRFFYRRRPVSLNAKLGNLTDFCRRWGSRYDYMLVMDADSVMDGKACISLLRMMEGNDKLGILQTNPKPVLRESLFGRMQQFAGRLYGSVFSYSLQTMFMGHACYIGHNAIIRMKPFVEHCILPRLSGKPPWGGKPLSHDIVESALMARAGYEVWFLPDVEGTYEEVPANILDFLIRERRWMQGNLQHLRFVFLNGLRTIHREIFLNGSLGYVAAPLWAGFLVLSGFGTVRFLQSGTIQPDALGSIELPVTMLVISSFVFLFMPRLLAFFMHVRSDQARLFGGKAKLAWSMLIETVFSFFFSSIVMIYISRFMWLWIRRRSISWAQSQRDDEVVPWEACFRHFGWVAAVGIACWIGLSFELHGVPAQRSLLIETMSNGWITPDSVMIGFLPIVGGFTGSILIVRFTSRTFSSVRASRLFCVPEEVEMPPVLEDMLRWQHRFHEKLPSHYDMNQAVDYAASDLEFYVRHRAETRLRPHVAQMLLPKIRSRAALSSREVLLALGERHCFDALHIGRRDGGADAAVAT